MHSGSPPERHLVTVSAVRATQAVEPPANRWVFPSVPPGETGRRGGRRGGRRAAPRAEDGGVERAEDGGVEDGEQGRADEVVGIGADLEPGTLLAAYRGGVFPMPVRPGLMGWWSPDPRGILPLDGLRVSRSLRRSCGRSSVRLDRAFERVISECAGMDRGGGWIDDDVRDAYVRLHHWGWAHSVETWDEQGRLAGGLYGVAVGGLFAGESMFHHRTDASKVALVALVELLRSYGGRLLDVQWATPHLSSLGVIEVPRREYLARLEEAVGLPQPAVFGGSPGGPSRSPQAGEPPDGNP